ncbi:related to MYND domain protein [Cephalotrichum gorgonifer]|uniref:Related to MYND domain protein n=1 Tax=Cephalotrichum gorgonifer TaxID=2041049 RepID=A0AAE8MW12_9PEZI|nr:related to MYND domain protein [Cephalotrichum gorgonifer]
MVIETGLDIQPDDLLAQREALTAALLEDPYNAQLYLDRASVYLALDYPDLASGDAYRALLLSDDARDDSAEYHELATAAFSGLQQEGGPSIEDLAKAASLKSFQILATSLYLVGCLKSAFGFCEQGLGVDPENAVLKEMSEQILDGGRARLKRDDVSGDQLPDSGLARREVYPWNAHEPDRYSDETLGFLNLKLRDMAPKCVVKATELPVLGDGTKTNDESAEASTCLQLGLFATEDIGPGEAVLREYTLLTANNRFKDMLCDACGAELPRLGDGEGNSVSCPECYDTIFCSQFCFDQAQEKYHPALCEKDVDTIAKDPDHKDADERLHFLLLARVLAMSTHQEVHPLDIMEVRYIWGDFTPVASPRPSADRGTPPPPEWTLPFSFEYNVKMPLHFLEKMDVDIYDDLESSDIWVLNTLYSKFRGTASARKNPRDGRPEVAAVHPFWCLANHDCNPNVTWDWGGRMTLQAVEKKIVGGGEGGVKKGEEILNHYCDVRLPVQDRREWAEGSLGGWCMCKRCQEEAEIERRGG